jgi:uncharacterized membrane protein YtjA (UPF0391 family)
MLGWILGSVVMAIIAGVLGFSGVAILSEAVSRILGIFFLLLSLVPLVYGLIRRHPQKNRKQKVRHLRLVPRPVEPIYIEPKEDLKSLKNRL